jgi:Activator of Hsp90 ATPase homolog 1-like protein
MKTAAVPASPSFWSVVSATSTGGTYRTARSSIAALSVGPITHDLVLSCSAEHAFDTYIGRIGEWWDPAYTANPETLEAVTIEPRVGGRVFAKHQDLGEHVWGEVTVWEAGRRLVHTFTLAQDREHPSKVAVEFLPNAEGSAVRFAHGGWTDANSDARAKFGDWPLMLERFAALADS